MEFKPAVSLFVGTAFFIGSSHPEIKHVEPAPAKNPLTPSVVLTVQASTASSSSMVWTA